MPLKEMADKPESGSIAAMLQNSSILNNTVEE
jgi:hypothetical protein